MSALVAWTAGCGSRASTAPHDLATATHAGATAHLILPARTLRAAGSMDALITVDNNTGHALHFVGCGPVFQVDFEGSHGAAPALPAGRYTLRTYAAAGSLPVPPDTAITVTP